MINLSPMILSFFKAFSFLVFLLFIGLIALSLFSSFIAFLLNRQGFKENIGKISMVVIQLLVCIFILNAATKTMLDFNLLDIQNNIQSIKNGFESFSIILPAVAVLVFVIGFWYLIFSAAVSGIEDNIAKKVVALQEKKSIEDGEK